MENVARLETTPPAVSFAPRSRLISRCETLLKSGLLIVALTFLGGLAPCGATIQPAPLPEGKTHFDRAATPAMRPGHQHDAAAADNLSPLALALVGIGLLALSQVPPNPKNTRREGDSCTGKNDSRGQELPETTPLAAR